MKSARQIDIPRISKGYRVELHDYDHRFNNRTILICAGTGMMLSTMDDLPYLRYCVDHDQFNTRNPETNVANWIEWMGALATQILVIGWFGTGNPKYLLEGLDRLQEKAQHFITYFPIFDYKGGTQTKTLRQFLDAANEDYLRRVAPMFS